MDCPECGCYINEKTHVQGVCRCHRCGCIHGDCYLYESYMFVNGRQLCSPEALPRVVPYRFKCLAHDEKGEDKVIYRVGWVDPETKLCMHAR